MVILRSIGVLEPLGLAPPNRCAKKEDDTVQFTPTITQLKFLSSPFYSNNKVIISTFFSWFECDFHKRQIQLQICLLSL